MKAYRDEITGRWHSDLPDVFDLICEKLRNREPFSFARYGDGEWNAIYGKKGHNCDGHEYSPDLGERLRKIVESKPKYLMGMQPLTVASERWAQIEKDFPGIEWVDADSIHNAVIDGKIESLFAAIRESENVFIVGPWYLNEMRKYFKFTLLPVPPKNCWLYYDMIINYIIKKEPYCADGVYLLCSSMMSEVLIDDLQSMSTPNSRKTTHTLIDIGSAFDPYCGVKSRRYHHKLNINAGLSPS